MKGRVTTTSITNAQIEELRAAVQGLAVEKQVVALCDLALGTTEGARVVLALRPHKAKLARARCVAFYNGIIAAQASGR